MSSKKNELRQYLKQKRQQISAETQAALSQIIIKKITALRIFKNTQHLGIYYPIQNEVNILNLLQYRDKTFYLPRINTQNMMAFHEVTTLDNLIVNRFGIPEPAPENPNHIPELIIVPMLGFDVEKHRLGYGKGYYDRYLNHIKKPFCLGIAYDFQQVPLLPHEAHDIKMDLIITNKDTID